MKKFIKYLLVASFGVVLFASCESRLDNITRQGAITEDQFFKTDADALEAVSTLYNVWRGQAFSLLLSKSSLSDDVYSGGGGRGDNASFEQLNEYTFNPSNGNISGMYSGYYSTIYRANLITDNIKASESSIKARVVAEAKAVRAISYLDLVSMWGPVPLVTTKLSGADMQVPNSTEAAIWTQIEKDLTEAYPVLPSKSSLNDNVTGIRLTKEAVKAVLGKAYLFQGKNPQAATILGEVINSNLYDLIPDFENVARASRDMCYESIFEFNALNDANNQYSQGTMLLMNMLGWRNDRMNLWGQSLLLQYLGWGFMNPTEGIAAAFTAMEGPNGFRFKSSMKTLAQLKSEISPSISITSPMYGLVGYFDWKHRLLISETFSRGLAFHVNPRFMRYAEVLLLAAEACVKIGDATNLNLAKTYINKVRTRAQLPSLNTVTLDDVKKEKRLELWLEGTRYQDLLRWGDAPTVLANQGQRVPVMATDGVTITYPFTNTVYGFKTGKHEKLPFPTQEITVNKNIVQNPGW